MKDHLFWGGPAFAGGVGLVQQWTSLPSPWWAAGCIPLLLAAIRFPLLRVPLALALGIGWAVLTAHARLAHTLPGDRIGRDMTVEGYVHSIPDPRRRSTRFQFLIDTAPANVNTPFPVRISWYRSEHSPVPELHVGQRWRLRIRLKPPHGLQNPGSFDYETWLFSRGIRATGYVRRDGDNRRLDGTHWRYALPRAREHLLNRLKPPAARLEHGAILLALALGYRSEISDQQWDLLTGTGTNHLMAVSGLHIGLVAGLLYAAAGGVSRLWRRRFGVAGDAGPVQRRAAWIAVAGAAVYASLAGFSLPTQRALIMLLVGMTAIIAFRQLRPAQALVVALLAVVVLDPFAMNTAGFWLSFAAVGVLIYAYAGRAAAPRVRGVRRLWTWIAAWGRIQWLLVLGLLPLTLFWFGGAAVVAAAANLLAIPLVGFVVVPLTLTATLASTVWPAAADGLLALADGVLDMLWPVLEHMQHWPLARWEHVPPPLWTLFPAAAGMALLLAPRGVPARWVGAGWLAPALFAAPAGPAPGELELTVLDVGQGTSVVARTARHTLLYDAGPKAGKHFDTGELVVLPFLKSRNIGAVDTLVVSHGDNDHIGGAATILKQMEVDRLLTGVPERFDPAQAPEPCYAGRRWRWDGVAFEVLHPPPDSHWAGNNASCVLRITAGESTVLLSGDIERSVERGLIRRNLLEPVDILLAPHHGSRTSSTPAFVEALQPAHTVFTAGLFNRYGFPKPDVSARYRRIGSALWISGRRGALTFKVDREGVRVRPGYRQTNARYWHYRPLQAPP